MEGERERPAADVLRNRQRAVEVAEPLAEIRLQVDRTEIGPRRYPALGKTTGNIIAVNDAIEKDHVNEPAHPCRRRHDTRRDYAVNVCQGLRIAAGDIVPPRDERIEPLELGDAERRGELVEPV